jgi:two-component system, cell cycle sensor histidine kinase PleC
MRQILVNLLSNAVAYTSPEGAVCLAAGVNQNSEAEIKVTDTGRGMSPDDLRRAVTRFGHVEDETSRERPGIGLGLPLAKGLTELLGGQMLIESLPGKGTAVTLKFPLSGLQIDKFNWGKPTDRTAVRAKRLLGQEELSE